MMPTNELEEYRQWKRFNRRPKLTEELSMVVRLRVAIKCVSRVYMLVQHRVSEKDFPDWMLVQLRARAQAQNPHPLTEEIEDVLAGWSRGERYHHTYNRAFSLSAKRTINLVKYGGRRG